MAPNMHLQLRAAVMKMTSLRAGAQLAPLPQQAPAGLLAVGPFCNFVLLGAATAVMVGPGTLRSGLF